MKLYAIRHKDGSWASLEIQSYVVRDEIVESDYELDKQFAGSAVWITHNEDHVKTVLAGKGSRETPETPYLYNPEDWEAAVVGELP